jgi:ABC-type multidrug transport system fused ATPase/permease subunit
MVTYFRKYWNDEPLTLIMVAAIVFRLLASIFARGWGMFDDHFIVVESAGSWVAGHDYNDWLPGSPGNHGPTGHNFFYPGLHFLLFSCLKWLGMTDPQSLMFMARVLHAALSLLTVYFGYRIAERLQGKQAARMAGLLLAVYWFMPWMSVRNLVEMTCIPFVMAGFWLMVRDDRSRPQFSTWFIAGVLFGLSVNIRPQAVFFPVGAGLVILFRKQWKELIALSAGALLTFSLVQGGIDFFIWGKPFAELLEYINVCVTERNDYISLPWYNYFLTIFALLIPPVSFFLFYGFLINWKRHIIVFLPTLLYFVFHSYFPNKQERFILPMIPLLIVYGAMGWTRFRETSRFWKERKRLYAISWTFFWIINTILLFTFSFTYSKKARVEAMSYLSRYPDITAITVVDEENSPELMPKFYLGQWPVSYNEFIGDRSADSILAMANRYKATDPVRFILFTGDKGIQPLVIKARRYFPFLVYETTIEPGFIDRLMHWLNPINKNRRIFIYRNAELIPGRMDKPDEHP